MNEKDSDRISHAWQQRCQGQGKSASKRCFVIFHRASVWCCRDYVRNQMGPDIDLMMLQMYPDSWLVCAEDCKRDWAVRWVRRRYIDIIFCMILCSTAV